MLFHCNDTDSNDMYSEFLTGQRYLITISQPISPFTILWNTTSLLYSWAASWKRGSCSWGFSTLPVIRTASQAAWFAAYKFGSLKNALLFINFGSKPSYRAATIKYFHNGVLRVLRVIWWRQLKCFIEKQQMKLRSKILKICLSKSLIESTGKTYWKGPLQQYRMKNISNEQK